MLEAPDLIPAVCTARRMCLALAAFALVAPLALPARAAAAQAPTAVISSVAVKHTARASSGYAGTVEVRLRICLNAGPRAVLLVDETRMLGTVTRASESWRDPLGVDLDRIRPYACFGNYVLSWALKSRFLGPGTYTVRIRVRDGYGRLSNTASFSLQPGLTTG
jgi:hypothetical protein